MSNRKFKGFSDGKGNFKGGTRHRKSRRVQGQKAPKLHVKEIDLHGFTQAQARQALMEMLRKMRTKPVTYCVCHGRGNHSERHQATLKPEVEKFCKKHGLHFWNEVSSKGGATYISLEEADPQLEGLSKRFKGLDLSEEET